MIDHLNWPATIVFVAFFLFVTVLGFVAAHWKRGDLADLHEWGLGGRRFGAWISWFLIGGDLYTAYTVIAVPSVVYAIGAYGFFAVPYTIMIYPLLYLAFPRLWAVAHRKNYLTAADYVLGRYGNKWLELGGRLHRHFRHHALYRLAARGHGKGDRGARLSRPGPRERICPSRSPSSSSRFTLIAAACAPRP